MQEALVVVLRAGEGGGRTAASEAAAEVQGGSSALKQWRWAEGGVAVETRAMELPRLGD